MSDFECVKSMFRIDLNDKIVCECWTMWADESACSLIVEVGEMVSIYTTKYRLKYCFQFTYVGSYAFHFAKLAINLFRWLLARGFKHFWDHVLYIHSFSQRSVYEDIKKLLDTWYIEIFITVPLALSFCMDFATLCLSTSSVCSCHILHIRVLE